MHRAFKSPGGKKGLIKTIYKDQIKFPANKTKVAAQ